MLYLYLFQWFSALFLLRLLAHVGIKQDYLTEHKAALGMPLFLALWAFFYWVIGSFLPIAVGNVQVWLAFLITVFLLLEKTDHVLRACKEYFIQHKFEQILFWVVFLVLLLILQMTQLLSLTLISILLR